MGAITLEAAFGHTAAVRLRTARSSAGPCQGADPRAQEDAHARDAVVGPLDLAGVEPGPDLDPQGRAASMMAWAQRTTRAGGDQAGKGPNPPATAQTGRW